MQKASHTPPTVQDYYRMIRHLSLDDRLALLSMLSAGIVTELQSEWLDHLWSDGPDDFSSNTDDSPATHVVTLDALFKKD